MKPVVLAVLLASAARAGEVRLALSDAVAMALESNLEVAIARLGPETAEAELQAAWAIFEPAAELTFMRTKEEEQSISFFGGADVGVTEEVTATAGLSQRLPTGGDLGLAYEQTREWSNSVFQEVNPAYRRGLELRLTQPLLDGGGIGVTKAGIVIAREFLRGTSAELQRDVAGIIERVCGLYWELVFRREDLRVRQVSVRRAEDLLEKNRIRVDAGLMAPIEILAAEAGLAQRRVALILAEDALSDAEDNLCAALGLSLDATPLPTDVPQAALGRTDEAAALETALSHRPELEMAQAALDQEEEWVRMACNGRLPELNLVGSYGWGGLGDTRAVAESEWLTGDYEVWSAGVELRVPLGGRSERGKLRRARADRDRASLALQQTHRDISVEVMAAVRQVGSDARRVDAQRTVKRLQTDRLDKELKLLDEGLSTSHDVLLYEEDLAQAESDEVRAVTDYVLSRVALSRAKGTLLDDHNVRVGSGAAYTGETER